MQRERRLMHAMAGQAPTSLATANGFQVCVKKSFENKASKGRFNVAERTRTRMLNKWTKKRQGVSLTRSAATAGGAGSSLYLGERLVLS
jgi:hypothetical protein